jgi:hypothetical protein
VSDRWQLVMMVAVLASQPTHLSMVVLMVIKVSLKKSPQ